MAISVGGAVGAGFNLIGRRPLAVISWGLILLVASILVQGLGYLIFGFPTTSVATTAAGASPQGVLQSLLPQLESGLGRDGLAIVIQFPISILIAAAVIRAVIEPEHRGFASMRFSRQEGALALLFLLYIPITIVVVLAWIVGVVLCVFLGAALSRVIGGFGGGAVGVLMFIALALAFMWLALRFSLAAPMTFAERRVRFFGSWEATRGEGWRLFGLAWLLVLIGIGLGLALLILFFIVGAVIFGAALGAAGGLQAFQHNPMAVLGTLGPLMIVALLVAAAIYAAALGCMQAIFAAPWAEVYRQLKGPDVAATFS